MRLSPAIIALSACTSGTVDSDTDVVVDHDFAPGAGPTIVTESDITDAPVFVFLFTHTEDHINHGPSEERYQRMDPILRKLANDYPDVGVAWTIQFQGSDALTVSRRDGETGVATALKALSDDGIVHFGYHGHHDPTYLNRPQVGLTKESSWEEVTGAFKEWTTCERDPTVGGCVAESGGGIEAVQNGFGQVEIVSGLGVGENLLPCWGNGLAHAIDYTAPDVAISLGIPDHGPASVEGFDELAEEFMTRMAPGANTSPTMFFMNDILRLNDGDLVADATGFIAHDEPADFRASFDRLDRSRPSHVNAGVAMKYVYTAVGDSPTKYAYANPDAPELPKDLLNSPDEIDHNYANIETNLVWIAGTYLAENPGSQFVSPSELRDMTTTESWETVQEAELDAASRWLVENWSDVPPDYAFDGTEYYSLRDVYGVLAMGTSLYPPVDGAWPIVTWFGPEGDTPSAGNVTVDVDDLRDAAGKVLNTIISRDDGWTERPAQLVAGTITVGDVTLNQAQMLYAMAWLYTADFSGANIVEIDVPDTNNWPATANLMEQFLCTACEDSSWTLRPATVER
jgi:hypothetical protein